MITIRTATHFNQRQDDEWAIGRESNLIKCSHFWSVDGGTVLSEHHGKGLALVLFPSLLRTPMPASSSFPAQAVAAVKVQPCYVRKVEPRGWT